MKKLSRLIGFVQTVVRKSGLYNMWYVCIIITIICLSVNFYSLPLCYNSKKFRIIFLLSFILAFLFAYISRFFLNPWGMKVGSFI